MPVTEGGKKWTFRVFGPANKTTWPDMGHSLIAKPTNHYFSHFDREVEPGMPPRDKFHDLLLRLLVADGWTITHDPYHITVGRKNLFVDLGAEKLFAAEREGKRIAVEIKTFGGPSEVHDLEEALGQYLLYTPFMRVRDPERLLYLAITAEVFKNVFEEPIGRGVLDEYSLRLLIFDSAKELIVQWIPPP